MSETEKLREAMSFIGIHLIVAGGWMILIPLTRTQHTGFDNYYGLGFIVSLEVIFAVVGIIAEMYSWKLEKEIKQKQWSRQSNGG